VQAVNTDAPSDAYLISVDPEPKVSSSGCAIEQSSRRPESLLPAAFVELEFTNE
jgi:hypothetical protein